MPGVYDVIEDVVCQYHEKAEAAGGYPLQSTKASLVSRHEKTGMLVW
jgi:hypothetical protein